MKLKDIFLSVKKRIQERIYYLFTDRRGTCPMPEHVLRDLARLILPSIQKMVQTDEGKAQLLKWKEEQEKAKTEQENDTGESA